MGPAIAESIVRSGKAIPPKVKDLFDKIRSTIFKIEDSE